MLKTDNLPLSCWLHASGRGRFLRVEPAGPNARKALICFDGVDQADMATLELAFKSGAVGNVYQALQFEKNVKRLMFLLLNGDKDNA